MNTLLGRVSLAAGGIDVERFRRVVVSVDRRDSPSLSYGAGCAFAAGIVEIQADCPSRPLAEGHGLLAMADARLDNRSELLNVFQPPDPASLSDADLVLRAYARWGEGCPARLLGDFAVAVFDPYRRRLFLARDHIGARPLYWARRGAEAFVSSAPCPHPAFEDIGWPIDEARVAAYLDDPQAPHPDGFFAHVFAVSPGHSVTLCAGGTRVERWWVPPGPGQSGPCPEEAAEELRPLLRLAVSDRVRGVAATGVHVSGGLDSSAVAAMATSVGRVSKGYAWAPPVSAAHPDLGPADERRRIEALGRRLGFPVQYGETGARDLHAALARPMECEGTSDLHAELPLLHRAESDGIRVLLSGWGGDEAFSAPGFGVLPWRLRRGHLLDAARLTRLLSGERRHPRALARALWTWGLLPMLPDPLFERLTPVRQFSARREYMAADLARRTSPARSSLRHLADPNAYLRRLIEHGHLGARMATWSAWSGPRGIVHRYPLTDRRILDFLLALTPDHFFHDGKTRYLARVALGPDLVEPWSKGDPANERLRRLNRLETWRLLAEDAENGAFDGECAWLDMVALRARLRGVPSRLGQSDLVAFAEMTAAVKVWHLARRHGAAGG